MSENEKKYKVKVGKEEIDVSLNELKSGFLRGELGYIVEVSKIMNDKNDNPEITEFIVKLNENINNISINNTKIALKKLTNFPNSSNKIAMYYINNEEIEKADKYIKIAGDKINPEIHYKMATKLEDNNIAEAINYYKMAAKKNYPAALNSLGVIFYQTNIVPTASAIKYLEKAAELGDQEAQNNLGEILLSNRNIKEAVEYFKKAAKRGNVNSQYKAGYCLFKQKDFKMAEQFYKMAAENGHFTAKYDLGCCYIELKKNKEAIKCFEELIRQNQVGQAYFNNLPNILNNLGNLYKNEGKDKEAFEYFQRSADLNNAEAQNNLGCCLLIVGKEEEALKYFQKSADQGYPNAINNLGFLFKHRGENEKAIYYFEKIVGMDGIKNWSGQKYVKNAKEALEELKNIETTRKKVKKAEHQEGSNIKILGPEETLNKGKIALNEGKNEEAFDCFITSAEQGNGEAAYQVALMVRNNYNIKNINNEHFANEYLKKAAELGNKKAQQELNKIRQNIEEKERKNKKEKLTTKNEKLKEDLGNIEETSKEESLNENVNQNNLAEQSAELNDIMSKYFNKDGTYKWSYLVDVGYTPDYY